MNIISCNDGKNIYKVYIHIVYTGTTRTCIPYVVRL